MLNNLKYIFFLLSISIFLILTGIFYFSEENIKAMNKSRALFLNNINVDIQNLPYLKNDTNNIVEYTDDLEIFKKKRKKYKFFDLLKTSNE